MPHNNRSSLSRIARCFILLLLPCALLQGSRAHGSEPDLEELFATPPPSASPWVFWYWMHGCVSKAGITADLEAMKDVGIGGAYLMPIKGPTEPSLMENPIVQLTPAWWEMVRHAMREADRLGLELAMHACDGFAVAGGPWITPELSMQHVVWTTTHVDGRRTIDQRLEQPATNEDYYRDIVVLAFPSLVDAGVSTLTTPVQVTTSITDFDAQFLAYIGSGGRMRMEEPGWIQYAFSEPFTCRSITVTPDRNNYQAQRLLLQSSDDGQTFRTLERLTPPRQGWQNGTGRVTYSIPPTTAKYFRFVFDKQGSEPGAEDLDSAKWSPVLKIKRIELSGKPCIHQFRGKMGEVWRVSPRTSPDQVPDDLCVPLSKIVDLTSSLDANGRLKWDAPAGRWTILRLGHTSTGMRNETGRGGKGLECDKLNARAVRLQFDHWFGETIRQVGPELAHRVLKVFHVDSWECGSQNWTNDFRAQFMERRGYDLLPYLPTLVGIPVESADISERFLYDFRQTIDELLQEDFFETMAELAHAQGCEFSAECVAPTMLGDGMQHFGNVDIPMGEFWLRSPTHDKPNDVRDAISAAHVYGKPIAQAEAFTQLRMEWNETPATLKALGDRQFCLGINRLVYHVFTHNPWLDRQPGMTLDNIGLYFQRDQTWWQPGQAWLDYVRRCQALLQVGQPVVDIAVFTGEELPRRAILPERLVDTLPGIIGEEAVQSEAKRLANRGTPLRELPRGVRHSANMADPANWLDALRGYKYDSVNRDALLSLAEVRDGRLVFPGGASYQLLVIPAARPMSPNAELMTPEVARKLTELADAGATIVVCSLPKKSPSLERYPECDEQVREFSSRVEHHVEEPVKRGAGQGGITRGPIDTESFRELGFLQDFTAYDLAGDRAANLGWTHRRIGELDLYFLSNQSAIERDINAVFRVSGKAPLVWSTVTGDQTVAHTWHVKGKYTLLPLRLPPNGSLFVIFRTATPRVARSDGFNWSEFETISQLSAPWQVTFRSPSGKVVRRLKMTQLEDWTLRPEKEIPFFSGTAIYETSFVWAEVPDDRQYWLDLGDVGAIAHVLMNGIDCGIAWTPHYRVDISRALHDGKNSLRIEVTNSWKNQLIGDQHVPESQRTTWTTAAPPPQGASLDAAGLRGPVKILVQLPAQ